MLALALLLRPTLSSLAEVHEFAHDPSGQHHELQAPADHGNQNDGGDNESPAGDALDTLVHLAHCCGQASTDFPLYAVSTAGSRSVDPPDGATQVVVPRARLKTLLRPPITA